MNVSDRRFTIAGWGSVDPFQIGEYDYSSQVKCDSFLVTPLLTCGKFRFERKHNRANTNPRTYLLFAVLTNVLMQIEITGGSIANCSKQFSSFLDFDPKIQFCAGDVRKNVKDACQVNTTP